MATKEQQITDEIEKQRALLQTYLASDMDIDEMDYSRVVEWGLEEVGLDSIKDFLGHWKDYAFLRGKLEGFQEARKELIKEVEKWLEKEVDKNGYYVQYKKIKQQLSQLGDK